MDDMCRHIGMDDKDAEDVQFFVGLFVLLVFLTGKEHLA